MKKEKNTPVRLRRLSIKNYKGIAKLTIDFTQPRMADDPHITVIGSENGLGKTSILECCCLVLFTATDPRQLSANFERFNLDISDLLIRAGERSAHIHGELLVGDTPVSREVLIKNGRIEITDTPKYSPLSPANKERDPELYSDLYALLSGLVSTSPNPLLEETFLFFHSHRKVQEGNPELGMLVERENSRRRMFRPARYENMPLSAFKITILKSLMSRANLFELQEDTKPSETIEKLNELIRQYAGGTIGKLRPYPDNTVDFQILLSDGKTSFPFDGLSSGQKEIISTLFLIWNRTRNNPSVVLIDEPELHLNAQWHRSFVKNLLSLAPHNQYIIATHSEAIMDSVNAEQRVLLVSTGSNLL